MHTSPTHGRRGLARATAVVSVTATLGLVATMTHAATPVPVHLDHAEDSPVTLEVLGTHHTGVFDESAAEIVAFHAPTQRTFVVNAQSGTVDVLDASDPTSPAKIGEIVAADDPAITAGAVANSIAVREDGLAVVAVEAPTKTDTGWLLFVDASSLEILGTVAVGALPDMVTISPDGAHAVVANEGEPADDFLVDPEGSVGIVTLPSSLAAPTQDDVRIADFHDFEAGGSKTLDPQVRVFGPTPHGDDLLVSRNLEPEYVAVGADGTTAYVALQEANAIAVVDLASAEVTQIWPLGTKDHSLEGNGLDASDRDPKDASTISIATQPLHGLYMPDGVNLYTAGDVDYLVTANEGDAREFGEYVEPARVKDLGKDGLAPICDDAPAATLASDAQLGRLNVSTASGLNEAGTCYEELHSFGARSFSIWTTDGALVFDSGDEFEQTIARVIPEYFNSNHSESNFEGRSDDKGPEPENLTIGQVGDRTYAFIGLERVSGVIVYDITDPANASYVAYLNQRDFSVSAEDDVAGAADPAAVLASAGDLGPEGLTFVTAGDSPTGEAMVIYGNEVSGTTTFVGVSEAVVADTTAPVIQIDGPSSILEGADASFAVSVTDESEITSIQYRVGAEGDWSDVVDGSFTVAGLATGPHTIQVRAVDAAENEGTESVDLLVAQESGPELPFADIEGHVFQMHIEWLAARGIAQGYEEADGTYSFRGSEPVLREQMAAFVYRFVHEGADPGPFVGKMPFADVSASHVFAGHIAWLAYVGVSTGYDDDTFRGGQPVLREQMAAFLYRVAGSPIVALPSVSPFTDVAASHAFYKEIVWLANAEVTTGYANGDGTTSFQGSAPVLREQMAAFLYRLDQLDA